MSQERYMVGRTVAIVMAFGVVVTGWIMHSTIFSQNITLPVPGAPVTFLKERTVPKLQLDPDEFWKLKISGVRAKGHAGTAKFDAAALEILDEDNLKGQQGKSLMETHPEAFEWHKYSENAQESGKKHMTASKRLLIAQYSNRGEWADILPLTKPVNMAYAKRWGLDIVFLNAQQLSVEEANPATLLWLACENRDKYDQVLLMNADAMMNDFNADVTTLFHENEMLVAQRIEGSDLVRTWKIFGTVSLWNLNHLLTPRIQVTWSNRFHENDPMIDLSEQVKPYAETEVVTVTRQIGHSDASYVRTMEFATKDHTVRNVDIKTRIARWAKVAKKTCSKYRIKC